MSYALKIEKRDSQAITVTKEKLCETSNNISELKGKYMSVLSEPIPPRLSELVERMKQIEHSNQVEL